MVCSNWTPLASAPIHQPESGLTSGYVAEVKRPPQPLTEKELWGEAQPEKIENPIPNITPINIAVVPAHAYDKLREELGKAEAENARLRKMLKNCSDVVRSLDVYKRYSAVLTETEALLKEPL
jgi:hypothetical protein